MNEKISDLLKEYKSYESISHAQKLLNWDIETYMPEKGIEIRGEILSNLELFQQEFSLKIKDKVESIVEDDLDDFERGIIRILKRHVHFYASLPSNFLKELKKVTTEASVFWRVAKKRSDFSQFSPYLNRIVDLEIQMADRLGYNGHPYNSLMDLFNEGFTVDDADSIFNTILNNAKPILDKILTDGKFSKINPLEKKKYNINKMAEVNKKVIEIFGLPIERFRMDVSAHPFTTSISVNDVRITTRYEGINFKSSLYSTIHECGHAIYYLQRDPRLEFIPGNVEFTAVKDPVPSGGFDESQSRFFENIFSRSIYFIDLIHPYLQGKVINESYSKEDIYIYFNTVRPSLIRVDADEVTYNFHIALRYEIEKLLIEGKIDVNDLPEIWNEFMEKYLGIVPKNDAEGVLQDIHWSNGSFGYFPSYTLGNVISAMIKYKIKNIDEYIKTKNIEGIKQLLREKIHNFGSIYSPKELLMKSFNENYNANYLIKYLNEKYLS